MPAERSSDTFIGPMLSPGINSGSSASLRIMGTGLMPDLVRAFDWGSTPLGPIDQWSETFRQVLSNLVSNALDAMTAGGCLTLRWRTGQWGLLLTVADTGSGMPPDVLERVFDAFYTTKGTLGTGLGLWVSKDIVARHQGSLKIRSSQKSPHKGTIVQLFLPLEA